MTTDSARAAATRRRRGVLVFLRDVVVIIVIAALVSFVVKTFVVRSFYIPSASMERTLLINDRILVDELTPRWTDYERGDIVVFKDPGGWLAAQPQTPARPPLVEAVDWVLTFVGLSTSDAQDHLVKRVIGLPGDHVVCCNALGQITVNGAPIDELDYLNLPQGDTAASNETFDVVVPDDSLWLLGDNRDRSRDSRAHQELPSGGFVPLPNVVGKAFFTTWPLDRLGTIDGHHDSFNGVPDPE
ncbi:signal peptidase I [Microbacterium sp. LWH12-1.2]|uniref:signal peptidase I n=1 Tax=Microbacterium sp. LWH12-1.2 TaxID=3135259 RepID=UPI00341402F6